MSPRTTRSVVCLIAMVVFAGCTPAVVPSSSATTGSPAPQGSAPAQPADQTFTYVVAAVPETLDVNPYADPGRFGLSPIQSILMDWDTSGLPESGCAKMPAITDLKPALAESYTVSEDGLTVTFKLRPNVKSAAGNVLSADDVVWSLKRMMAEDSRTIKFSLNGKAFVNLENPATAIDPLTVAIHFDRPASLGVAIWTHFLAVIWDSKEALTHATAEDPLAGEWLAKNIPNFGPWQLESFDPGTQIVYTPNPNFYGDRGNISRLVIKAVPDPSTRALLLQTGEADWAARLDFSSFGSFQAASGVTVQECQSPNRDTLTLQQADARFKDPLVRQAISMAIDRAALVASAYAGHGLPAKYGLSQGYPIPQPSVEYKYDTAAAKDLLAQAGYPDGMSFTIKYSETRPGPWAAESAIQIKDMLADIGIDVELQTVASSSDFTTMFNEGNYEGILYSEAPLFADPYYSASTYSYSKSTAVHHNWFNAQYDEAVELAGTLSAGAELDRVLKLIAEIPVTDPPHIYLVDSTYLVAHRSNISNYQARPDGDLRPAELVKQ
jgi:peptide/nickel transport system substrate-binding protein